MVVKFPAMSDRNPWEVEPVVYVPIKVPELLMPDKFVLDAPGIENVAQL